MTQRNWSCVCRFVLFIFVADGEKVSDYEMKLMDLDTEHLGIPVRSHRVTPSECHLPSIRHCALYFMQLSWQWKTNKGFWFIKQKLSWVAVLHYPACQWSGIAEYVFSPCVCVCVCLDVNQGGMNYSHYTQRLVICHADLLVNFGCKPKTRSVWPTLLVKIP